MSHVDSKDEELLKLLEENNKTDDSKESDNPKKVKKEYKNDDYNTYDVSDDKELDDKEW